MNIPSDLKYSQEHEWVRVEDSIAYVGITDFAQGELGDIVYLDVDSTGETLAFGEVFGSVEAVKTVSDLFMPLTGTVLELNPELEDHPEYVNTDPYGKGWIIKVQIEENETFEKLLDASKYKNLVG